MPDEEIHHAKPKHDDDEELARLDEFLLNRIDDETGDRIATAGGDEGILDVSEVQALLLAVIS